MASSGAIRCDYNGVVMGLENVLEQYQQYVIFVPRNFLSDYQTQYGGQPYIDTDWTFDVINE